MDSYAVTANSRSESGGTLRAAMPQESLMMQANDARLGIEMPWQPIEFSVDTKLRKLVPHDVDHIFMTGKFNR